LLNVSSLGKRPSNVREQDAGKECDGRIRVRLAVLVATLLESVNRLGCKDFCERNVAVLYESFGLGFVS